MSTGAGSGEVTDDLDCDLRREEDGGEMISDDRIDLASADVDDTIVASSAITFDLADFLLFV